VTDDHDEDFAALFAASERTTRLERGQEVTGTVVAIGSGVAFVDVGSKGEATIMLDELRDDDGALEVGAGDRLTATITSTSGGITLSRRLQRGAATARELEDAVESGLPVEGRVETEIKGGYSVRIARQRAFCPHSQIDIVRDTAPEDHIGRVYTFRILEYGERGRKFVVSRRALLEAEQKARADEVRRSIAVGDVVTGRVVSVRDFGAFLDLGGGVQGLLHVSEMGWSRVESSSAVATPGQELSVKVLRIDQERGQIALGLKQLLADPWEAVPATFEVGRVYGGRVDRHAPFGVFVQVADGVVGLVPRSETALAPDADLRRAFPTGSNISVTVLDIDTANRRMSLSVQGVGRAEEAADVREYTARDRPESSPASFGGSLADKLRGALDRKD